MKPLKFEITQQEFSSISHNWEYIKLNCIYSIALFHNWVSVFHSIVRIQNKLPNKLKESNLIALGVFWKGGNEMFFEIYFSVISSSLIFGDMPASTDPIEQVCFRS